MLYMLGGLLFCLIQRFNFAKLFVFLDFMFHVNTLLQWHRSVTPRITSGRPNFTIIPLLSSLILDIPCVEFSKTHSDLKYGHSVSY